MNATKSGLTENEEKVIRAFKVDCFVAKEPWEMTKAEYGNQASKRVSGQSAGKSRKMAQTYHAIQVIKAVKEGKPVPAEVLSDYPELAALVD